MWWDYGQRMPFHTAVAYIYAGPCLPMAAENSQKSGMITHMRNELNSYLSTLKELNDAIARRCFPGLAELLRYGASGCCSIRQSCCWAPFTRAGPSTCSSQKRRRGDIYSCLWYPVAANLKGLSTTHFYQSVKFLKRLLSCNEQSVTLISALPNNFLLWRKQVPGTLFCKAVTD